MRWRRIYQTSFRTYKVISVQYQFKFTVWTELGRKNNWSGRFEVLVSSSSMKFLCYKCLQFLVNNAMYTRRLFYFLQTQRRLCIAWLIYCFLNSHLKFNSGNTAVLPLLLNRIHFSWGATPCQKLMVITVMPTIAKHIFPHYKCCVIMENLQHTLDTFVLYNFRTQPSEKL